jgi:archaellum component FlaC
MEEQQMDFLKEVFGEGSLTWEQFSSAVNNKGFKLADLATGNYVSKKKYDDDIKTKTTSIEDLTNQISTRDTDISNLKKMLEDSKGSATQIEELNAQIAKMQGDYENAKKDYEGRLSKQSYEFAVKEYANGLQFSSKAAKRDFERAMISEGLKMKNGTIIGADDFKTAYETDNEDSFVKADPNPTPAPEKPIFGQPTPQVPDPSDNAFISAFNFAGVRPHDTK